MIGNILRAIVPGKVKKIIVSSLPDETEFVLQFSRMHPISSRVMIDVGAGHGTTFEGFARDGWKVYAFEPDADNRKICEVLCKKLGTVVLDPRAVSNKAEKNAPFFRSDLSAGISGLSPFHSSHVDAGTVETVTIDSFCQEHQIEKVGHLKVDTEGFDLFVLQGMQFDKIKPDIIMCEFEDIKTVPLGYTFHDLCKYLTARGYHVLVSEWYPAVKRGGPHWWRRFETYPCELLDKSSWGNIIATTDKEHFDQMRGMTTFWTIKWKIGNYLAKALAKVYRS